MLAVTALRKSNGGITMASRKDAKQEFMDAYNNMKTGMKKNLSKENLKTMGKKISEEYNKPGAQIAMAMLPIGKGAKIASKAIRKLKKPKPNNEPGTYKPSKKEQKQLRKFLDLNNLD